MESLICVLLNSLVEAHADELLEERQHKLLRDTLVLQSLIDGVAAEGVGELTDVVADHVDQAISDYCVQCGCNII